MAVPANTLQTFQTTNNAEDVENKIYQVSPMDRPLQTLIGTHQADATFTEWPIDALEALDTNNAQIEGDDVAIQASTTPTRVGNYLQTLAKTLSVADVQQAIRKYGVSDEWGRQTFKKGKALGNDFEAICMSNQARVVGAAGTARKLRGLAGWITTNDNRGAGGVDGNTTTAATDGTQRNFTEALFKDVVIKCATASGDMPTVVMAGLVNRANMSSQLSGNTTRFNDMMDSKLNATITVYRSDYGNLKLVPNRWQRDRDMFFLNPSMLSISTLQPLYRKEYGVTGLSRKGAMAMTKTLRVHNEAAHGVLADLNTAVI
jgi:hypothetical protein